MRKLTRGDLGFLSVILLVAFLAISRVVLNTYSLPPAQPVPTSTMDTVRQSKLEDSIVITGGPDNLPLPQENVILPSNSGEITLSDRWSAEEEQSTPVMNFGIASHVLLRYKAAGTEVIFDFEVAINGVRLTWDRHNWGVLEKMNFPTQGVDWHTPMRWKVTLGDPTQEITVGYIPQGTDGMDVPRWWVLLPLTQE